ncbi:MAG: hypothetical protein E7584_04040 [Ruminococcaceae bacterium]|nr:hypothetical protein [Oscillospiraceae bacterium]
MLGYIRTDAPELRLRDSECYRAIYCGLCRQMGKCTGQCSRLSLSYDFAFLAAFRMSLTNEKLELQKKRCFVHPLKKRNMATDSPTLAYCADASAILTYHKCRDDIDDEKGFKKLRARLASGIFSSAYRRAKRRYPTLDATVRSFLQELRKYEKDTTAPPSADAPASIFGNLMATVCSEGLVGVEARIATTFGRAIGHWIYLVDAADDYRDDLKGGSFNPFVRLFGDQMTKENADSIAISLKRYLSDAEGAFLLIDNFLTTEIREILCNILYLGLPKAADLILEKAWKGETDKNEKSL